MCEDLENIEALKLLYSVRLRLRLQALIFQIAKHLFMLNRNGLLEVLLSEAHFKYDSLSCLMSIVSAEILLECSSMIQC